MDLISVDDMKIVDENSTYLGVPSSLLMENAGNGVSRVVQSQLDSKNKNKIVVFAGTGNNGGDGFVAARHLAGNPLNEVKVFLVGNPDKIRTNDAKLNWNAILSMDSIEKLQIRDSSEIELYFEKFQEADIIVDALLGTGIYGKIREPIASIIKYINKLDVKKVSIDIPSGMNPETGKVTDICVKADVTVTFHKAKPGLLKNDQKVGKLEIVSIGIPPEAEYIAGPGDLRFVAKKRKTDSHKGDFGKVLVIGGSDQYCGAPAIASLAALKTGSDLVIIVAPKSIATPLRSYSPNLIVRDYPDNFLTPEIITEIKKYIEWASSIIIGPGLGLRDETVKAVNQIIELIKIKKRPILIDADAIKSIADNKNILKGTQTVITPHLGEFKIFTKNKVILSENILERAKIVNKLAKEYNTTILLKGNFDIIANGARFKINKTGTPAMTVGGTGDCLSGIIGSLLGRKISPFRSAVAGAFLCGKAGELAEKEANGPHILATDLLKYIPFQNFL
ncbi:MAG: NAD(P)H-hydrate dehydratase [Candidatus Helarchaeota archaeon]